jgi:hypothetical protein
MVAGTATFNNNFGLDVLDDFNKLIGFVRNLSYIIFSHVLQVK